MPRVPLETLYWGNGVVLTAGALAALGLLRWLRIRGELARPLAAARCPSHAPIGNLAVAGALGLFLGASILPVQIIRPERFEAEFGSAEWFTAFSVSLGVRLLLGVAGWMLLAWLLRRPAEPVLEPPAPRPAISFPAQVGLVLAVTGAALALCTAQAELFRIAAEWRYPEHRPPEHVVLTALQNNAWGLRGEAVLAAGAVVVAPLFEEVVFRGLLLVGLWQLLGVRSAWPAVLLSGVLFGAIHYQVPQTVVPLITFGIILGMVQVRTQRLWIVVAVHALFNLRTMLTVLLNPDVL